MPNVMNNRLADSIIKKVVDAIYQGTHFDAPIENLLPDEDYRELRNEIAEMIPTSCDISEEHDISDEDCLATIRNGNCARTCEACPIYEEER